MWAKIAIIEIIITLSHCQTALIALYCMSWENNYFLLWEKNSRIFFKLYRGTDTNNVTTRSFISFFTPFQRRTLISSKLGLNNKINIDDKALGVPRCYISFYTDNRFPEVDKRAIYLRWIMSCFTSNAGREICFKCRLQFCNGTSCQKIIEGFVLFITLRHFSTSESNIFIFCSKCLTIRNTDFFCYSV